MRLLALALALLAAGCTCDTRRCTPATCPVGCCTAEDTCLLNPGDTACGQAGNDCRDCGTGVCDAGACFGGKGCTPTSCPSELICDLDAGKCTDRPSCADGGCPVGLTCIPSLKVCATHCAVGSDCPVSAKNCSSNACLCFSDGICQSGQPDAGGLSCDPVGKVCVRH